MPKDECSRRNTWWGFTWIEWIIIIGLIAILASLVFPTFAHARRKIVRMACINESGLVALASSSAAEKAENGILVPQAKQKMASVEQHASSWFRTPR